MYIDGDPVLHIVDEATRFQAARWLRNLSAKHTWEVLRHCWIDTYTGPPDYIFHDAGKNFASKEFRQHATSIATVTKSVPVEAHWSIGLVERAHPLLRRAYKIITEELKGESISKNSILQMAVKSVNDSAGPDGLIPTLLVFGAYPRMTELDPPTPSTTQRATAIKRAMEEISKIRAVRQVNDALHQRNGPSVTAIHSLPLNSPVLVWREGNAGHGGKWTGPFALIGISGETCQVQLPSGPTDFRSTVVKPYYRPQDNETDNEVENVEQNEQPEGNETGPTVQPTEQFRRNPGREKQLPARFHQNLADITVLLEDDHEEPRETRNKTIEKPPSTMKKPENVTKKTGKTVKFSATPSYKDLRQKEINGLLEKKAFEFVNASVVPKDVRIFGSRFVDEIKNPGTEKAYEKSRLVIQA
jgi:hypothetical protein